MPHSDTLRGVKLSSLYEKEMVEGALRRVKLGMSLDTTKIKERLRLTREAIGLEMAEFAAGAGMKLSRYHHYEDLNHPQRLTLEAADRLRTAHDLTLDWLFYGDLRGLTHERHEQLAAVA